MPEINNAPATPATGSTSQLRPQSDNYCFHAPRTDGAPYPRFGLDRAVYDYLFEVEETPPELAVFDQDMIGYALSTGEHLSATRAIAGVLYRQLEQEGSESLNLMRALCIAVASADTDFGMVQESIRVAIFKAFGEEVR